MKSYFLRLLQPLPLKEPFEVSRDDLSDMKAHGLRHNLFPLLYARLVKYRHFISPKELVDDILRESKGLYLKSIALSAQQEAIEKDIFSLLRNHDIPAVIMKGNEIAREIYDDPNCRSSVDIDILIRREEAVQVDSFLTGAGYAGDSKIPLIYCLSRIHHATYYQPRNHMYIEIHWNFGVPYFYELTSEEIWKEVFLTDAGERKLSSGMLLIMLLIHHHMHSFRELKILVDILWAFHKYGDKVDWQLFAQKIKKAGLSKTTLITLSQMNDLWKESVHEMEPVQALKQELENTGCRIPKFLLSYFKMDLDKEYHSRIYKDKLLARFALDRWPVIILSFPRTLFPVPEAIKEVYKDKRNWTLPYNYLRFIKWRIGDWTGIRRP